MAHPAEMPWRRHRREIAGADIHQRQIGVEPHDRIVPADVMTAVAKISEQRGLAVKTPRRDANIGGRSNNSPRPRRNSACAIVKAEVADQQAPTRHALGKGLQADQQRVEKRRVASGDERQYSSGHAV